MDGAELLVRYHLFKNRLPLMNGALDAYALRQQTIAKNIANVNSPHYRPQSVNFEDTFKKQEEVLRGSSTENVHIPIGASKPDLAEGERVAQEVPSAQVYFSGENHVNIDKEMSTLAQNQIRYRFVSQMVNRYFTGIQSAIQGQSIGK